MAPRETVDTAVIVRHYEETKGCPHCSFEREADAYEVDRLLDGNMMVWDIRQETDARGFCHEHYSKLLASRSRSTVAIMLESHLRELQASCLKQADPSRGKKSQGLLVGAVSADCYICRKMARNMENFAAGVAVLWKRREDFRELFAKKGNLCLTHYAQLMSVAAEELDPRSYKAFNEAAFAKVREQLDSLADETKFYCSRFDYRVTGADKDFGASANVLERLSEFLYREQKPKLKP